MAGKRLGIEAWRYGYWSSIEKGYFVKSDPGRRQLLEDEGLVFDTLKEKWEDGQRALEQYRDVHGDLEIPRRYKVPAQERWPEDMWGISLGVMADNDNNIRCQGHFVRDNPERKQWLEERGFRFETKFAPKLEDDNRWEWECSVLPALAAYRDVHGDLNVFHAFVVPSEKPWPEESWGLPLGKVISSIRYTRAFIRTNPER